MKKATITKLLLWSQRYTKMDMIYLVHGGFWIGLSQVINTIISLALVVAFANLLPKEEFGIYRYILSIASMLNIFLLGGIQIAVTRAVARGDDGSLMHAVKYQLRWNILMMAAFFLVGLFYFVKENMVFAISFFVLGVFTPATFALNTYGAFLTGKKEFRFANISNIFSTLFYAVGAFAALILSGKIVWLIVAYSATGFFSALFFYIYTLHLFKPKKTNFDQSTIQYGKKLSFISVIAPITSQIDKIILVQFWGPAQLATYSLAMAVPGKVVPYLKKFISVGAPKFATRTCTEINKVLYGRIYQGMTAGLLVTAAYVTTAPFLFKYLLPQYIEGVLYSQILAISFIFAMPTRYLGLLFQAKKMTREIFLNTIITSTISILLYIFFGMYGRVLGLTVAFVISSFLSMLVNLVSWKRTSKYMI